ncbi:MAG: hypothetical protein KVP17_003382 [Porospora cf. gigantea B]|uniref:uncharacterized protein n=1 Tax=Porospora cf. gigantea B TaxID=2853592 RepID=UPI003571FAB6|nr:MAG: hypothetical protein KVP17_003382 [Porospora cf. gigantea B]
MVPYEVRELSVCPALVGGEEVSSSSVGAVVVSWVKVPSEARMNVPSIQSWFVFVSVVAWAKAGILLSVEVWIAVALKCSVVLSWWAAKLPVVL